MKLADHQFANDVKMWNMQNEYNSPSAQVQRLKDAGLNPNLMYGNGSAATGNASQMPQYSAPTLQAPQIAGNLLDFASKLEDLKTKRIGNQLTLQQAATEESKRNELASRASKNLWDIENGNALRVLTENRTDAEIKVMMSKLQNDSWYRRQVEAEINLTRQKILTEGMTRAQKLWEIVQMQHRISEIDANVGLIKANTRWTDERTLGQKMDNIWNRHGVSGNPVELISRLTWMGLNGVSDVFDFQRIAEMPAASSDSPGYMPPFSLKSLSTPFDSWLKRAWKEFSYAIKHPRYGPAKHNSKYSPRLRGAYPSYIGY